MRIPAENHYVNVIANELILKALTQCRNTQTGIGSGDQEELNDVFNSLFEILNKADSCSTAQDILTLESDHATILQCYRFAGRMYYIQS